MKNIIVLGSNGFVGKSLCNRLDELDYNLFPVSRDNYDLKSVERVNYLFSSFERMIDIVVLAAGKVGGIKSNMEDPYNFLVDNLMIQNNVINACIKYKVKKVIFLGSSCIYPKDASIPIKEEALLTGSLEETNLGYSLAKIAGLKMCEFANKQYGRNFVSLMPCNLYGPNDHFNLGTSHALAANVKKIVDAKHDRCPLITLWGNGQAKREWLYIDDLIDCIIWAIDNIDRTDTFLNVGTGESISMLDMMNLICEVAGYKPEIRLDLTKPNGTMNKCLDVTKINTLGWKAKTDLRYGIKKTIEYYESIRGLSEYKTC